MPALIYIADPMCSWCYGFAPELSELLEGLPGMPVDIIVGGLRAYQQQAVDEQQREMLLAHWQKVHAATGLPFAQEVLSREGFVYNTEPACRAIVAARQIAPAATYAVLQALQIAFYAEGRDITQGEVLAEIAAAVLTQSGFAIDAVAFQAKWAEEATILATHADFAQTKKWGVDGFPTLVLERSGKLELITSGFVQVPVLVERLQAIVDKQNAA